MKRLASSATCYLAILLVCASDNPLFTSFQQGSENNCVSIALIKAMMGIYGVDKVYEHLASPPGQYVFRLKDGSHVELTQQQLDSAIARTGFKMAQDADQRIRAYADTCYAIMCMKHRELQENSSFAAAVDSLCNGYETKYAGELLGVQLERIRPHGPKHLAIEQHIIVYNSYHAVYASKGLYDESKVNGTARIGRMRWRRAGLKTGIGLRGLSGALRITSKP